MIDKFNRNWRSNINENLQILIYIAKDIIASLNFWEKKNIIDNKRKYYLTIKYIYIDSFGL